MTSLFHSRNLLRRSRIFVVTFLAAMLLGPSAAHAAVVNLLYLAGGELRSVGFDGTQFLGSFTSLETPDPAMSGISYDPFDDILYYLAGSELRSVGFDGTQFLGSFTSLETPDPAMSGISVIRVATAVPEPGTLALLGLGLVGIVLRRRIKAS